MSTRAQRPYRQWIPRPAGAEVVEPEAAFARLEPAAARALTTAAVLERAFAEWSAPGAPAPEAAGATPDSHRRVAAAVLLAVTGDDDDLGIALIRRATHLRANPGEIAFPGGRLEPGEDPLDAALREAEEEVALPRSAVHVLGALPPVSRASRPEPIAAFVGRVPDPAAVRWAPNPEEVDELLVTPMADLCNSDSYWEEEWRRQDGQLWRMSFFSLGDDLVWGASARILVSLFDRLAGSR